MNAVGPEVLETGRGTRGAALHRPRGYWSVLSLADALRLDVAMLPSVHVEGVRRSSDGARLSLRRRQGFGVFATTVRPNRSLHRRSLH
jgi:hypothetical protein